MHMRSFAAMLALALPIAAQTEPGKPAEPAVKTEKLWHIEATGLGG